MSTAGGLAVTALVFAAFLASAGCRPSPTPIRLFPFLVEDSDPDIAEAGTAEATSAVARAEEGRVVDRDVRAATEPPGRDPVVHQEAAAVGSFRQRVMIEPAVFWYSADADYKGIHPAPLQRVVEYFRDATGKQLGDAYSIVDQPGPGVIRIRTTIIDVVALKPDRKANAEGGEQLHANSGNGKGAPGPPVFLGRAAMKAELFDSETNQRLASLTDRQEEAKQGVGSDSTWAEVKEMCDRWAKMIRQELDEGRCENRE